MKKYKIKRFTNNGPHTQAQVIRVLDGAEMLSNNTQLSVALRYVDDMNNKTDMGLFLINKHNKLGHAII